ncbi:hypothetical protein [Streptomyces venezuelae]|uniref:hypothetical protein n=1 Tax=Streptomyces venezuelae TaxID=54571 RepID=UPI0034341077
MPRLTRRQKTQLDGIEHFLNKILAELTNERVVVTMRSGGAATTEFHNRRTDQWISPIRPASLAYLNHALRHIAWMRNEAEPKEIAP